MKLKIGAAIIHILDPVIIAEGTDWEERQFWVLGASPANIPVRRAKK